MEADTVTDLLKPFFEASRKLAECYEREKQFLRGGGATRGSGSGEQELGQVGSPGFKRGREINPARPTQEREYLNAKPERPLLPALVPTSELLPRPSDSDESDSRVQAD